MAWVWIANALVIAIMTGLFFVADAAGPWLCGAFFLGFVTCYIGFRCWRFDRDEPVIKDRSPQE